MSTTLTSRAQSVWQSRYSDVSGVAAAAVVCVCVCMYVCGVAIVCVCICLCECSCDERAMTVLAIVCFAVCSWS